MSSAALGAIEGRPRSYGPALDAITIILVLSIVLLGLIMVTSASITVAGRDGDPFFYLERQLLLLLVGVVLAAVTFSIPSQRLEQCALPLLLIAGFMLFVVLVPGLGHVVNGSRRWLRLAGLSFQVSEAARVLTLIYIASYAVRYWRSSRCCCCSSRISAPLPCCSSPASGCCFWPEPGCAMCSRCCSPWAAP